MGCTGRCDSNPCLNNGTCTEGYNSYTCDCRFTAFKGPICADGIKNDGSHVGIGSNFACCAEIGVNMQSNSLIRYDFIGTYKSTIAEKLRVGFTTTEPKGFLVGLFSNITGEYLTLLVSNSGHLRLVFDFGEPMHFNPPSSSLQLRHRFLEGMPRLTVFFLVLWTQQDSRDRKSFSQSIILRLANTMVSLTLKLNIFPLPEKGEFFVVFGNWSLFCSDLSLNIMRNVYERLVLKQWTWKYPAS